MPGAGASRRLLLASLPLPSSPQTPLTSTTTKPSRGYTCTKAHIPTSWCAGTREPQNLYLLPKPCPSASSSEAAEPPRSFIGAAGPKIGSTGTDFLAGKETLVSLDVSNIFRRSATLPSRSLLEGGRKARERLEVCCLTQLTNYFQVKRGQSYKRCLLL